ncbi:MAG: 2-oxoglutarate and iron-dependent oxygenase domain-containing protein [Pseudomonadota bacterium]
MPAQTAFDPFLREQQLRAESVSWDTAYVRAARPGDIPLLDLTDWLQHGRTQDLQALSRQLRIACEEVGFFSIVGHGVDRSVIEAQFEQVRQFHAQPEEAKQSVRMDRAGWPHGGMGYLPMRNTKLPARDVVNVNEAFLVKADHRITLADNQWPNPSRLPHFRAATELYARSLLALGKRLLPVFADALEMPSDFFDAAFAEPSYRLRMTHYPPVDGHEFGINPHVDTTFMTILAQDSPGLAIYSERLSQWIAAPALDNAFVVNTGELLRQWTNDRFVSTKHFATNNTGQRSRYSIPFFFNANADYVMQCISSCTDADNPPRYAPVSYAGSQAVAQGE